MNMAEMKENSNTVNNNEREKKRIIANITSLEKQLAEYKQQLTLFQKAAETEKPKNAHADAFWDKIYDKCRWNPDFVKELVTNQPISMADTDKYGRTLLLIAAKKGSYEVVQLCINLNADIYHKDNDGRDALYCARKGSSYHVEQLLLFAAMNTSVGDELRQTADTVIGQTGMAEIIDQELTALYKDEDICHLVKDALVLVMTSIIEKKLAFSDDLLSLCLHFECAEQPNVLETNLWKCIAKTCNHVLGNGDEKEWFWFKEYMLKSQIWCKDSGATAENKENGDQSNVNIDARKRSFLYYELLQMIDVQSTRQLNELQKEIAALAQKQAAAWKDLVTWNTGQQTSGVVRQDTIPNGITSLTHRQLTEHGSSSSTFDAHSFYDYSEYLSQILLLAHQVDHNFHKSVQQIFDINPRTKTANVRHAKGDGMVQYLRGPVKLMERAKNKAENDYSAAAEQYPTAPCIIDINRCAFVFNDIESLLHALNLFVSKVNNKDSGNIIRICRYKNTFQYFDEKPDYADVKLNVVIRGKTNDIVGEVQFLLQAMKNFKDKAHNLYSVQRQKEYYDNSVSQMLPVLLDEKKQLFMAGDVKSLSKLLVVQNKTADFLMRIDGKSGNSILTNMCAFDQAKAVKFISGAIPASLFLDRLFAINGVNQNPLDRAFNNLALSSAQTVKYLLSMPSVKQGCVRSVRSKYRIFWNLFQKCDEATIEQFSTKDLGLSKEEIVEAIKYRYTYTEEEKKKYAGVTTRYELTENIVSVSCRNEHSGVLEKVKSLLGVEQFVDQLLVCNAFNFNAVETCCTYNNLKALEFLLSIDRVKDLYSVNNKENHSRIFRLLFWVMCQNRNDFIMDEALRMLHLSQDDFAYFMAYRDSIVPSNEDQNEFKRKWFEYYNYLLIGQLTQNQSMRRMQKVYDLMEQHVFTNLLFKSDGYNINALEYAIANNKHDMISFVLSNESVRDECMKKREILWRIIFWLTRKENQRTINAVCSALVITKEILQQLQVYKISEPDNMSLFDVGSDKMKKYWDYTLSDSIFELSSTVLSL